MSTSVISSTITDAAGTALSGARVVARLVPAPAFRADASEITPVVETVTNGSGQWSLTLERTAGITPSGSHYEILEYLPDGVRTHTIQVGASPATMFASLVTPPPAADGNTYLTQTSADARYQALGGGFGTPSSVGTANAGGASTSASRADHVHDIADGAIDHLGLFVAALRPWTVCTAGTRPASPSEGDGIYETDTDRFLIYDGSAWQRVAWTSATGRTWVSVSRSTNQSIPNVTVTPISWTTEAADLDGFITATSTTLTVPAGLGGLYGFDFRYTYASAITGENAASVTLAGTLRDIGRHADNTAEGHNTGFLVLAAGDTLTFNVYQASGGAKNVTAASLKLARLGI